MRLSVLLTAIFSLIALSAQPACAGTVPFELTDNRIIVQAHINGAGPFFLIVDTGTSGTTLTPSAARRLHLETKPLGPIGGAGRMTVTASAATLESLNVAGQTFARLPIAVINMDQIQRNIGFTRFDGIVGYDVLQSYVVGIDMDRSLLTLSRSSLRHPPGAHVLPFVLRSTQIYLPATINGAQGTVMFDSGDRSSLTLFRRFASNHGFYQVPGAVRNTLTGFGIGGPLFADVFRTQVVVFATTIPNVLTRATLDTGGFFATSTHAGSVGLGLMKRFNTIVDYPHRTMFAWPSKFFSSTDRYDLAGMWVSNGSRGPVIAFVAKGGSADKASIRAGESLVSLDGRDVGNLSAIEIRDWFNAQPQGTRVALVIRTASGQTISRSIVLQDRTVSRADRPRRTFERASERRREVRVVREA